MKKILFLFIGLLYFVGCSKSNDVVTLKSGLKYQDDTVGTGNVVKMGDLITIDFAGWIIKDSSDLFSDWSKDKSKDAYTIGNTKVRHQPFKFVLKENAFVKGSAEGIAGMKVGGTRTIIIPSELAYGKKGIGPIPPNTSLKLVVEVRKAHTPVTVEEWKVDSTKYKTTKDGLKYIIISEGTGPKADSGDVVTVNYSGFLLNGKKFDSSVERDEPFSFTLGQHQVIPGWDEGIRLLNKGAKAKMILPPSLAYGDRTAGQIPPNSTLVFDVQLLNIKKK